MLLFICNPQFPDLATTEILVIEISNTFVSAVFPRIIPELDKIVPVLIPGDSKTVDNPHDISLIQLDKPSSVSNIPSLSSSRSMAFIIPSPSKSSLGPVLASGNTAVVLETSCSLKRKTLTASNTSSKKERSSFLIIAVF